MYIIFSVCLHRHSIGVLGGKACQHNFHISSTGYLQSLHLSQCQWKCEVLKFLLFILSKANFVTLSLVKILQQETFSVLSSAGFHNVKELPVFLVLSLPLLAICIVY